MKEAVVSQELLNRITMCERYFGQSNTYGHIVKRAIYNYEQGNLSMARQLLDTLPNETQLLESLMEKLKRSAAYRTLKRIAKGEEANVFEVLKGYFSLGSHIAIECERGNYEYTYLLDMIHHRIGELIYKDV